MVTEDDILIDVGDVAKIFKKAKKTIYNMVEAGIIPPSIVYRVPGLRFKKHEINGFIEMMKGK